MAEDSYLQRILDNYDETVEQRKEIERLRAALALAVGELSTYGPMKYTSPEQLMQHFLEEARRG